MTTADNKNIAVLGAGSWGTTLAVLLARNGYHALLWGNDPAQMARLARDRCNAVYLPEVAFPANLIIHQDLSVLAKETDHFLIAVPSHAFRPVLQMIKPHLSADALVAWATKGIEPGSAKLLSSVVREELSEYVPAGVISGPSFAREVALGLPTALVVAARDTPTAGAVAQWLRNERTRVYTSHDVIGVELGGAVKNVMAIAAGISDGLGFGANARAALITRGLAEITRLGVALGGAVETFMGLTGVGDLVLTCTDNLSRNRQVGLALGKGRKLQDFLAELGQVAEGVTSAPAVRTLAQRMEVEMPITEQVCRVLFENLSPQAAVEALLRREPRQEEWGD
jgi:glycerol-3-phosphate dehydrogenase (NAD(P)+)